MAKQMILSFDVENQTLKRKDENKIVEKSKNYVHAIFFFTEEWDDTQKAAIIENGGMRFKVYLENNECDIPNRAVSHDGFTITIVGEDEEKNITITTTDLFIAVQKNNASDIQEEYIKNITSDTLDLTREGENCNLEIPESYKNCYIVTNNDVSDITLLSSGTYSVTLSEEMASVVTGFKQNLYVDWENDFPEVVSTLEGIKITNCYPSKKMNYGEELPTYYMFSATDGVEDFNMAFFYEDDTWKVSFTNGTLADKEWVSMEVGRLENEIYEKSKVVANPTLSGDEATLEGAEIDGIKYKVGGGSEVHLYRHILSIGNTTSVRSSRGRLEIYNDNNTPFSDGTLAKYIYDLGFVNGGTSYYPIPLIAHNSNVGTFKNSFYVGIQGVLRNGTYSNKVFSINETGQLDNYISALNIVDIITQIL